MPTRELVSRDAHRISLGGQGIDYVIERRRGRRGVRFRVDGRGLAVSAPLTMPHAHIESLMRESQQWIVRKVAQWSGRRVAPLEWVDGAQLPWLGGHLTLRVVPGARARAMREPGVLRVTAPAGIRTRCGARSFDGIDRSPSTCWARARMRSRRPRASRNPRC